MTFTSPLRLSWCHTMLWPRFSLHNNLYSLFPPCQQTLSLPFILQSCCLSLSLAASLLLSQGYEDWLRHKADCSINECPVDVVQQGKVVRTQSHKLRVRMASLEEYSTWGHKATLRYCCIAHFFYNCLSHSPLLFLSAVLSNVVSFLSCSLVFSTN